MTSDVNKWHNVKHSLRQSSVLLAFLYVLHYVSELEYVINIITQVLIIALSLNRRP